MRALTFKAQYLVEITHCIYCRERANYDLPWRESPCRLLATLERKPLEFHVRNIRLAVFNQKSRGGPDPPRIILHNQKKITRKTYGGSMINERNEVRLKGLRALELASMRDLGVQRDDRS